MLGDAATVQEPFPNVGRQGSTAQLTFQLNYATTYEFHIGLKCVYPSCDRIKLFDSLQAKDGNARLYERYYRKKQFQYRLV